MSVRPAEGALPRLVALDLDGTLLTNDKRLTPRARAAVRALDARGVHVVVCTGRPPRSAVAYAEELGLHHPFVCFNGAALYDPKRRAVRVRHHLDAEVARIALARLRAAFPGVMAGLETDHGWYLDDALYSLRSSEARLGPEEPTGVGDIERFLGQGA
ncbi:MAG: HAD-IIB family hydrolase, partial [Deinococcales bacterium]